MRILVGFSGYEEHGLLENIKKFNSLTYKYKNISFDSFIYTNSSVEEKIYDNLSGENKYLAKIESIYLENIIEVLKGLNLNEYDGFIFLEDEYSNEIVVKLGRLLDGSFINNVTKLEINEDKIFCEKLSYNNNIKSRFQLNKSPFILSLKEKIEQVEDVENNKVNDLNRIVYNDQIDYIIEKNIIEVLKKSQANENILVVVGRGVDTKGDVDKIREYVKSQNYTFGVTRPVAMNGWGKIEEIVGVSGKTYSPKVCITIGVSGSAAFYIGIENSEFIASINNNKKAPILSMSDITVIDDYKNVIDRLFEIL